MTMSKLLMALWKEPTEGSNDAEELIEDSFGEVMMNFVSSGDFSQALSTFRSIAASKAMALGGSIEPNQNIEEFFNYDLETKLWDLAELLITFRNSNSIDPLPEYKLSSITIKQENYIIKNPKLRELAIIIHWLQKHLPVEEIGDDLERIYNLLLANQLQEAIEYANDMGNFPLALILIGSSQDYTDPKIDNVSAFNESTNKAAGVKHKLLWKDTVHKLSKSSDGYESLIYNYLSGGDISENLAESSSYESYLLLYLSQLLSYQLDKFTHSLLSTLSQIIQPQLKDIEQILDTVAFAKPSEAENPLRVIHGTIMINKQGEFLKNFIENNDSASLKPYILRIITHLSIIQYSADNESIDPNDLTKIISLYISKLYDYEIYHLIPLYAFYIPNEEDSREIYSLFLSQINDDDDRLKQIEISRALKKILVNEDEEDVIKSEDQDRMTNVLRRTVERVMNETSQNYSQHPLESITCDQLVDKVDTKLYRSIDWFFAYSMYEDAILASIVVIRRFLHNGKLDALKHFAKNKDFKKLIRDYDASIQIYEFSNESYTGKITEETKQELIEYSKLVSGLTLIDEWKAIEKVDGNSSFIENSITKTNSDLKLLILTWFKELINQLEGKDDCKVFEEFRSIYIPYLIIELLQVYRKAKDSDKRFLRLAFDLINEVADDKKHDYLPCFTQCGRLQEFLVKSGELSAIAVENGISGVFI